MRIREIGTKAFGRFSEFKSGQLDSDIVVVYGKNEAGKSTLFNLIYTLLYGFSPASRDKNPYFPWDGGPMNCEGRIQTSSKDIQVFRTMGSSISGSIVNGDKSTSINNRPLEETEGISREIFEALYALTQDELSVPNSTVWQKLQDQLLGGQFASFLKPTGKAIEEIQSQADSLYRSSNRGRSKEKELVEKLNKLNEALRTAQDNEGCIRESERRLKECQMQLSEAMERKKQLSIIIDRANRLAPVMRALDSINQLESMAGEGESYMQLPQDVLQEITQLQNTLEGLEGEASEVQEDNKRQQERVAAYTNSCMALCSQRDRIEALSKAYSQTQDDIRAIGELEYKLDSKREELEGRLREFSKEDTRDPQLVNGIDEVELREGTDRVEKVLSMLKDEKSKLEAIKIREGARKRPPYMAWISAAMMLLGITGLILGGNSPAGYGAGLLSAIGAGFLLYYIFTKANKKGQLELEESSKREHQLQQKYEEGISLLKSSLNGVRIAETRILSGDDTILMDVHALKECIADIGLLESQILVAENRIALKKSQASQLISDCGLDETGDVLGDMDLLEKGLDEAILCQRACIDAKDRLSSQEKTLRKIEEKAVQLKERKKQLVEVLERAQGESLQEKNRYIISKREMVNRLRNLKEQLVKEHDDLDSIMGEISLLKEMNQEDSISHDAVVGAQIEIEELEKNINHYNEEIGSLCSSMEHLQKERSLDDIKSEILSLQQEKKQVLRKHDRLILMRNIIYAADRRFRDEHQPDVLKKAEKYLSSITEGRYTRLLSSDNGQNGLLVRTSNDEEPVPAAFPLSRGTLEQIYLSLRLAVIDHLDENKERLPLFLDETFVNWDNMRLENGIRLLEQISGTRQIFLFTCHEELAGLLERIGNSVRLNL